MKQKKVKAVEKTKSGEIVFNLYADEADADWIRSARLLKQGKKSEVERLSKKPMYKENKTE